MYLTALAVYKKFMKDFFLLLKHSALQRYVSADLSNYEYEGTDLGGQKRFGICHYGHFTTHQS